MEPHALTLQKTNADAVVIFATPTHGPLIVKEMAKIPYRPTILTCSALADPMLYKVAGEPWDGVYSAHHGMVSLPEEPAGAKVGEILLKYNPKFEGKLNMPIYGAVWMMHFVEGLKNAGRNLSTESFIRGMEMIKDWKAEGMGGLVTYGPGCHHGINANRMVRCVKGKSLILTDFTNHKPLF
jgi:ABC-type branched-subunit amino acid transport system substrate-binding protein